MSETNNEESAEPSQPVKDKSAPADLVEEKSESVYSLENSSEDKESKTDHTNEPNVDQAESDHTDEPKEDQTEPDDDGWHCKGCDTENDSKQKQCKCGVWYDDLSKPANGPPGKRTRSNSTGEANTPNKKVKLNEQSKGKATPSTRKATPRKKATPKKKATPSKDKETPKKKATPSKDKETPNKKATPSKDKETPNKKATPSKDKETPPKKKKSFRILIRNAPEQKILNDIVEKKIEESFTEETRERMAKIRKEYKAAQKARELRRPDTVKEKEKTIDVISQHFNNKLNDDEKAKFIKNLEVNFIKWWGKEPGEQPEDIVEDIDEDIDEDLINSFI